MSDAPTLQQNPPPEDKPALAPPPRNAGADRPVKPAARTGFLPTFVAFAALLASAAVGYLYLQQNAALDKLQAELAAAQAQRGDTGSQLTALEQALQQQDASLRETLQSELAAANARSAAQDERLAGLSRDLTSATQRIRAAGSTPVNQDSLLAEAASLLRMAQQQLLLARDTGTAIRLYLAADELLRNSDNPAVFGVREELARELATLQALPGVDVEGLYAQLGAQSRRIDTLAVRSGAEDLAFTVQQPAEAATGEDWLGTVTATLSRYFVVTKREAAVTPLLSAEQEFLIRRSIQLQIEQARLALLQGQPDIYRMALDAALAAIAARLQDQDGGRALLAETLATLRDAPIRTDIPALNGALVALQQLLADSAANPAGANR
jgi:uroporphyrin-3 C-methyltransferase